MQAALCACAGLLSGPAFSHFSFRFWALQGVVGRASFRRRSGRVKTKGNLSWRYRFAIAKIVPCLSNLKTVPYQKYKQARIAEQYMRESCSADDVAEFTTLQKIYPQLRYDKQYQFLLSYFKTQYAVKGLFPENERVKRIFDRVDMIDGKNRLLLYLKARQRQIQVRRLWLVVAAFLLLAIVIWFLLAVYFRGQLSTLHV